MGNGCSCDTETLEKYQIESQRIEYNLEGKFIYVNN